MAQPTDHHPPFSGMASRDLGQETGSQPLTLIHKPPISEAFGNFSKYFVIPFFQPSPSQSTPISQGAKILLKKFQVTLS
jgi:hypothetical protein